MNRPASNHTAVLLALDPTHFPKLDQARQRLLQGTPHPQNPVMRPRPGEWDGTRCKVYGTVLFDAHDQLFKMWYSGGTDTETSIRRECGSPRNLGYAFSNDGVNWTRPSLGLIEYNGSSANNLIMLNGQAPSVFLTEEAEPDRRFMMITEAGQLTNENHILYSPDGIHWTPRPKPPVESGDWGAKTHEPFSILFDPRDPNPARRWKGYSLLHIVDEGYRGRAVGYFEAADPEHWVEPPKQPIMSAFEGMESEIHIPHVSRFYDTYVMIYDAMEPNHHTQAEVAVSHDGVNFRRVQNGVKLIPNGPPGSVNAGKVCVSPRSLFEHDGKIWWYHTVSCDTYQTCPRSLYGSPWYRYTNLVQWRQDGMARLEPIEDKPAIVTSARLELTGGELGPVWLNAATNSGGALVVEVISESGQALATSRPFTGDALRASVKWQAETSEIRPGRTIRLRVTLVGDAVLYAIGVGGAQLSTETALISPRKASQAAKWTFTAAGKLSAAPVVVGDKVFVTSWDQHLYALAAETGKLLWKYATGNAIVSSPAAHGGTVFIASRDGHVYALNSSTGELLWKSPVHDGRKFNGFNPNGAWIDCTPAIGAYAPQWNAIKRDKETGKHIRVMEPEPPHWLFVGAHDRQMHAFDLSTGHEMWRTPTFNWILSRPAIDRYTVYFGSMDGHIYALDAQCGALKWRHRAGKHLRYEPSVVPESVVCEAVCGNPLVNEGSLYCGGDDGFLYALDAATGAERWAFQTKKWIWGQPRVVGGLVCFASADAHLYAVDRQTGRLAWKTGIGSESYGDVVLHRGRLLIANTLGKVLEIDPRSGSVVNSRDVGANIRAAPAVAEDGTLFVADCAGQLTALACE